MDKINFDSLKHIKAPQVWLEKAAAIPDSVVQKREAFPMYRVVAAASLVLVSAVGVLVFLFFGGSGEQVVIRHDGIAATDVFTDETTVGETLSAVAPAAAETVAVSSTDAAGNTVISYEEKPASTGAVIRSTQSVTFPTAAASSIAPSNPASEHIPVPTEAPAPTSVPVTESPVTQPPTENDRPPGDTEFYGMFSFGTAGGSGYNSAEDISVFCRLYDSSGSLVGDSPLYSPQREATILSWYSDGSVYAYYDPAAHGLRLTEDAYEYIFYDAHGNELYRNIKFVF